MMERVQSSEKHTASHRPAPSPQYTDCQKGINKQGTKKLHVLPRYHHKYSRIIIVQSPANGGPIIVFPPLTSIMLLENSLIPKNNHRRPLRWRENAPSPSCANTRQKEITSSHSRLFLKALSWRKKWHFNRTQVLTRQKTVFLFHKAARFSFALVLVDNET